MALKQATCPWCGSDPSIVISMQQAFCGTESCAAVCWNPSLSAVENLAEVGVIDLENLLRHETD